MSQRRDKRNSSWALQVAVVFGIPIRVHFTFALILLYVGYQSAAAGQSVPLALIFVLLLFACVVLHELGHAVTARLFGVRTREIVLYPIGGIARLARMPSGAAELLIAGAGPAVNLFLAAILFAVMIIQGAALPAEDWAPFTGRYLLHDLWFANLVLCAFNLLPAFPMDGGRVLRAGLSLLMPEVRATTIAAAVGQTVAVMFAVFGLFNGAPMLILIALFVFLGAGQEAAFHRQRAAVRGKTARAAMLTKVDTLAPQDTLADASEHSRRTRQEAFPVVDLWNRVVGVLPRGLMFKSLAERGPETAVLEVMARDFPVVSPGDDLEHVLKLLQSAPGLPVMVLDQGNLAGMITPGTLAEFIQFERLSAAVPGGPDQSR